MRVKDMRTRSNATMWQYFVPVISAISDAKRLSAMPVSTPIPPQLGNTSGVKVLWST